MTYRIRENGDGTLVLVNGGSGNLARNTSCELFITSDRAWAEEARDYLNQDVSGLEKRKGSQRAKSTFGVF